MTFGNRKMTEATNRWCVRLWSTSVNADPNWLGLKDRFGLVKAPWARKYA